MMIKNFRLWLADRLLPDGYRIEDWGDCDDWVPPPDSGIVTYRAVASRDELAKAIYSPHE